MPEHVLGDGCLGNPDPEFEQLAVDPGCAPERVLPAHSPDEVMNLARERLAPGRAAGPRFAPPMRSKAVAAPLDHALWLDDANGIEAAWPEAIKANPKQAIEPGELRGTGGAGAGERRADGEARGPRAAARRGLERAVRMNVRRKTRAGFIPSTLAP